MAVSDSDVQKIAKLARLHVADDQLLTLTSQLNDILSHMDVLQNVDTTAVTPATNMTADGMPLREDVVAPIPMNVTVALLTAQSRDGFILVPRLSTHGDV